MISLRRVRLVDWHFFDDSIIELGELCLFAGDNGSGKSTIIDAIQYAMAADLRKARFNAAAGDKKGGRDLAGYVRCKLGAESTEYLRDDSIAHVMLEFADGGKGFSSGACVEAFADGRLSERFWIRSGAAIDEVEVRDERGIGLSSRAFRDRVSGNDCEIFDSKKEYLRKLTSRLGVFRRNAEYNPYLEAFTRSVSFTPLVSVDKFVCDYILEDKPVDISTMKANLESYKEAEREAEGTLRRIASLKKLALAAGEWRQLEKLILLQEYLKLRVDRDLSARSLAMEKERERSLGSQLATLEAGFNEATEAKRRIEITKHETEIAVARNDAHHIYSRIKERIESLGSSRREAASKIERAALLKGQCAALLGRELDVDAAAEAERVEKEWQDSATSIIEFDRSKAEMEAHLRDALGELSEIEKGIFRYPESPARLRDELCKAGIAARILADLSEVSDPDWANAVEGWLNTLRFAVLVEPDRFKEALDIYNSLPRSVAGAKLPNLAKMRDARVRQGSLAKIVDTESPYARLYIDYVLGDVMASELSTLRSFEKAVTKECMAYSGHTASRIREEIYTRPYLGKAARERRRNALVAESARLRDERDHLAELSREAGQRTELYSRAYKSLIEIASISPAGEALARLDAELATAELELAAIDTADFLELESMIQSLAFELHGVEARITALVLDKGGTQKDLEVTKKKIESLVPDLGKKEEAFAAFMAPREELIPECEAYAEERIRSASLDDISLNYELALKGFTTRRDRAAEQYRRLAIEYDTSFSAIISAEPSESVEAERLLERLEGSELPAYREKIAKARLDAEREFKDHFISRLAEFIEGARESFREINDTLKSMAFGHDQYRFALEERADRRGQLEIVRKAAEIASVEDGLFAQLVDPNERAAAQALFDRILRSDLASVELRSICDYRTYFTYDIKIRDTESKDPATGKAMELSLSKVIREKSGGEAQTPYYVAIAASFYRFYKERPESTIRLVLFDEAFNKMDDERISKILELFKRLRLQVVTAVPTEKIEAIAPHMDRVNLVIRREYSAFVRDFRVTEEPA